MRLSIFYGPVQTVQPNDRVRIKGRLNRVTEEEAPVGGSDKVGDPTVYLRLTNFRTATFLWGEMVEIWRDE